MAQQGDAGLELEWTAPKSCPTREEVIQHIRELLGAASRRAATGLRFGAGGVLHARARVVFEEESYTLELTTHRKGNEEGKRTLRTSTCEESASAAAVIIAMALDDNPGEQPTAPTASFPVQGETNTEPPSEPSVPEDIEGTDGGPIEADPDETTKTPEDEVIQGAKKDTSPPRAQERAAFRSGDAQGPNRRRSDPAHESAPRRSPRRFYFLGGGAIVDFGSLPRAAPGPAFLVGLRRGPFQADLRVFYLPQVFAEDPQASEKGGRISLFSIGPHACFLFPLGPLDLGPCAGLELGRMRGEGSNLQNGGEDSVFWLAAVGGIDLSLVRFRPFLLRAWGTMVLPTRRFSFEYQREDGSLASVHTPQSIAGRFGLFVEVAF